MLVRPNLENDVLEFVSNRLAVPSAKLSMTTRLGADLGLDGDDASEFMAEFAAKFDVDLSEFVFDDYFAVETAFNPIGFLFRLFRKGEATTVTDVTIDDLNQAAGSKNWSKD